MDYGLNCKKCHKQMQKWILSLMLEKEDKNPVKSENSFNYKCVNEKCEDLGKIKELKLFKKL